MHAAFGDLTRPWKFGSALMVTVLLMPSVWTIASLALATAAPGLDVIRPTYRRTRMVLLRSGAHASSDPIFLLPSRVILKTLTMRPSAQVAASGLLTNPKMAVPSALIVTRVGSTAPAERGGQVDDGPTDGQECDRRQCAGRGERRSAFG
jgi:hypothetical protein